MLCTAHARLAGRREWVLNEKRLAQRGGLDQLQRVHAHAGTTSAQLSAAVDTVSAVLDITTADPPLIHAALL